MKTENYFRSLKSEVDALRDRVRYLIDDTHWQTDGEWKESVVRHVLRRHLPQSVSVGRGFVVTAAGNSHQIDVLIFDADKPVLFKDGDLVFVTPDSVLGVLEIKTQATPSVVGKAAKKLADDMLTPLGIRVSKSLVHNEYNDRKNNTHTTITSTAKTTIARQN